MCVGFARAALDVRVSILANTAVLASLLAPPESEDEFVVGGRGLGLYFVDAGYVAVVEDEGG